MVGGGQLARMTHQAAIALGQSLTVLSVSDDDCAALVTPDVQIGHHTDLAALRRFGADCDVITFDHEHVPTEHIRTLAAEGHALYPAADALQYAQDKSLMRARLAESGIPVPPFEVVPGPGKATPAVHSADVAIRITAFGRTHGFPVVVKTARGGYDGRGVVVVPGLEEAASAAAQLAGSGALVLEAFVPMRRELAAVGAASGARRVSG